jgi:sugar-specific transcriptional regulator TrmB
MINKLKQIGLGNYEAKALEVLLKEKLELRELSRKAGIPFGKVYSIIKSLKEKRLINETNSRPKLVYVENASETIAKLIKEKQEKDKLMMRELREIITHIDKNKGQEMKFFQIGTTIEDNKKIQLRTFQEAEKEVLQILNIHHKPGANRESKSMWEREIINTVKKGVKFKSIYPKNCELPIIVKNLNKNHPSKFKIKRFDTDFVRCDIIDGKKVMLKLVTDDPILFGGILFIKDEKLAENLKRIFNQMWEQAI